MPCFCSTSQGSFWYDPLPFSVQLVGHSKGLFSAPPRSSSAESPSTVVNTIMSLVCAHWPNSLTRTPIQHRVANKQVRHSPSLRALPKSVTTSGEVTIAFRCARQNSEPKTPFPPQHQTRVLHPPVPAHITSCSDIFWGESCISDSLLPDTDIVSFFGYQAGIITCMGLLSVTQ